MSNIQSSDVVPANTKQGTEGWVYSDIVKDHFFNPRNIVLSGVPEDFDGVGMVGSPACGDVMKIWIKVDTHTDTITDCKWQTFGCASAIASTSALSELVKGMAVNDALKLQAKDVLAVLGGLPIRKVHCSVLGDKALRSAINDYFRRTDQLHRMVAEGKKEIDTVLHIFDTDIEHAVLEGARTFEQVQVRTKVGTGDASCVPEAEQLTRFYVEKYFGAGE